MLYDELRSYDSRLREITAYLESDLDFEERKELYGEEFEILVKMNDVYTTLTEQLVKLQEQEGMTFHANRIQKNANLIIRSEHVYV